jgi:uncharacterized protein YbaR (Trm112 family)
VLPDLKGEVRSMSVIDPKLLEILACPFCKSDVVLKEENRLVCVQCRRAYPIREGIPVMLIDEATMEEEDTSAPV